MIRVEILQDGSINFGKRIIGPSLVDQESKNMGRGMRNLLGLASSFRGFAALSLVTVSAQDETQPPIAEIVEEAETSIFINLCDQVDTLPSQASPNPTTSIGWRNLSGISLDRYLKSVSGGLVRIGPLPPWSTMERPSSPNQLHMVINPDTGECVFASYPGEEPGTVIEVGTPPPPEIYGDLSRGLRIDYEVKTPGPNTVKIVPRSPELEREFFNFVQRRIASDPVNNVPTWIHIFSINDWDEVMGKVLENVGVMRSAGDFTSQLNTDINQGWINVAGGTIRFFNVRTFDVIEDSKRVAVERWIAFNPEMFNNQTLEYLSKVQSVHATLGYTVTFDARYDSMIPMIHYILMGGLKGHTFPVAPDIDEFARKKYPFAVEWSPTDKPQDRQSF